MSRAPSAWHRGGSASAVSCPAPEQINARRRATPAGRRARDSRRGLALETTIRVRTSAPRVAGRGDILHECSPQPVPKSDRSNGLLAGRRGSAVFKPDLRRQTNLSDGQPPLKKEVLHSVNRGNKKAAICSGFVVWQAVTRLSRPALCHEPRGFAPALLDKCSIPGRRSGAVIVRSSPVCGSPPRSTCAALVVAPPREWSP